MNNLPIISNCDDCCGACCQYMRTPPGYTGDEMLLFATEEDERRFYSAPDEAHRLLDEYWDKLDAIPDGEVIPDAPCCWLDTETNRCKFYEWRPSVCREFDPGSDGCRIWRAEFNLDL